MSVSEFFGELKEGLSWPTVWTRLHQLYPPSNRYIASYVFPLYTVMNSLGNFGQMAQSLRVELFKCEGYVRRRLLENLKEGMEEDEYAFLLKSVSMIGENTRNIYDAIAHISANLSMIVAEGFSPPDRRINSYGSNVVSEYPIYMALKTTPDQFPGWKGVTDTLSEWKNPAQGYLSWKSQGPRLAPNETVKVTSDSIWYVTKIEQCFQENVINRNKIRVPPILWQRLDEIKSLQQKILNPPPPPTPSSPPPPPSPQQSLYPYPPYAPPLSAFGRPVVPIEFEEANTSSMSFMPRPPPQIPPKLPRSVALPPPPALPPLLPLLPGLLPLVAMDIDTRSGGRFRKFYKNNRP